MNTLIFVGGLALLLAGVIWAITSVIHPNNHEAGAFQDRYWVPALAGQGVSYWLGVLGLVGLQIRQMERAGILGVIGFVMALLGSAATIATNVVFAYVLPLVAKRESGARSPNDLLARDGPIPWISLFLVAYLLLFAIGYILVGIAVIRAGVLPGGAGWLLIVGMIVSNIGAPAAKLFWLRKIGGVLFGIGLAWLGLALILPQ